MWTPINRDWTVKPPLGTPLRTDGHWSVQGLVGCWLFNEGAGNRALNLVTSENSAYGTHYGQTDNIESLGDWLWGCGGIKLGWNNYHQCVKLDGDFLRCTVLVFADTGSFCMCDPADTSTIELSKNAGWSFGIYKVNGSDAGYPPGDSTGHVFGVVVTPSVIKCLISNTVTDFSNTLANSLTSLRIGFVSRYVSGGGYYYKSALVYNRTLSPNEMASLSANPYQVCQP